MRENRKGGALERFSRALDLPADIVAGLPRINIIGGSEVYIENHKGILLYNDTDIHINGGNVIIKLHGDRMSITSMSSTDMLIRGRLLGVDFVY